MQTRRKCAPDCTCGRHRPRTFTPEGRARLADSMRATNARLSTDERTEAARRAGQAPRPSAPSIVAEELERRGAACEECGATESLVWHHRRPSLKSFGISEGKRQRSAAAMVEELAKCALLCRPCHGEAHAGAPARLADELGISFDVLKDAADRAGLAWHATS